MRAPTILLVESDLVQTEQLVRALEKAALPRPVHLSTGEAAVRWLATHDGDACVLDYQLDGTDGLEALSHIRRLKPSLPVIMVSGAGSEAVAVAAFHAGVLDYVPKQPGYPEVVAELVARVVQSPGAARHPGGGIPGPEVPPALLVPTYENRLRAIGRQLDVDGYRHLCLMEVPGGFVVRAVPPGGARMPEALEFPDRDFPTLIALGIQADAQQPPPEPATRSRLLPMGYRDFLFALGRYFDARGARAITVAELDDFVAVGGLEPGEGTPPTALEPFQELLHAEDLVHLVDAAFEERQLEMPAPPATRER